MANNSNINNSKELPKEFGTFRGVFLPSILTILGVIMYLRLGWVVGNVGLIQTILIVTISSLITFITGLSISSTATNMKVGGGGAYFMISRSFGLEAGAAVGLPLFLAQTIGVSFYIAGFSESVHSLFPEFPLPVIGIISLIVLTVLAYISADLALKMQLFIFIVIIASLLSFFFGGPPKAATTVSQSPALAKASFWVVFAVFFPAVTGIEAGIAMSGDLKDPAKSLPRGTLLAVLSGYIVYLVIPIFLAKVATEEMLINNPLIMKDIAYISHLILLGIWGATLSSALGALLGAPRTLQALARDRVVPLLLGKGFGPSDTPRIATSFTFIIALVGILLGDINAIAPVLSMFFLTSYGVLNLIAGLEGVIGNPSWRPTFRTPWLVSLAGAGLCVVAMFMINPGASFVAGIVVVMIYFVMIKRNISARWLDMRRSVLMLFARFSIYRLEKTSSDSRSWRPNILVLSGSPTQRFYLIYLADAITHGKSFLTVASIVPKDKISEERIENIGKSIKAFLAKRNIPAFIEVTVADDFIEGAMSLVRNYGLGPLTPNTVLFGETEKKENFLQYADLITITYRSKRNVIIVREGTGDLPYKKREKQILVWWGGKHKNAGLMLALGYMLQTSPEWKKSQLLLKTVVKKEEDKQSTIENLDKYLVESRLQAQPEIVVEYPDVDVISGTIRRHSQKADLVFLGMRPPGPDESSEEYAVYYENLLKRTEGFPYTALVLTAEDIRFGDIFQ